MAARLVLDEPPDAFSDRQLLCVTLLARRLDDDAVLHAHPEDDNLMLAYERGRHWVYFRVFGSALREWPRSTLLSELAVRIFAAMQQAVEATAPQLVIEDLKVPENPRRK